jgi:tetratricopeptide (TPR) repeat protein
MYKKALQLTVVVLGFQGVNLHTAVAQETGPNAFSLSARGSFQYTTADPKGRQPSSSYPEDPADYYIRRERAQQFWLADDCAAATSILDGLVAEYADDSELWLNLGRCQSQMGRGAEALSSFENALALGATPYDGRFGFFPTAVMTQIGWLHADAGDTEEALSWLQRAVDARYIVREFLAQVPQAAAFAGDPRFAALAGTPSDDSLTRDERWRHDIAFLYDHIARVHYDANHAARAAEIDHDLRELSGEVSSLTDTQITARLMLVVAKLGTGHDLLFPEPDLPGGSDQFAWSTYLFSDGLYVIAAEDETLEGARIEAYGDIPAEAAIATVSEAISKDNNMTARSLAPLWLDSPMMLEALRIIDNASDAAVTIIDRGGRRRVVVPARGQASFPDIAPPPEVEAPLYLSRPETLYWSAPLPASDALFVQINGFQDAAGTENFVAFVERLRREISGLAVQHVILDLRRNNGGNDFLMPQLLRVLTHFDMEPSKGELYVLIGRRTFSAAQMFITRLEPLTDAIWVGEPSGSSPTFIGRTGQFTLPYSRLSGTVAAELAQNSWPEDHRIWIAPDVPVALSSEDYFVGNDPALDAVLELIADGSGR